jgi:antitoxin VapB
MPLYIRDDEVDALAVKVQAVTGARTKTDAVRTADARRCANAWRRPKRSRSKSVPSTPLSI